MIPNLLPDTLRQITTNLLNVTLDDKIDNPYLRAALTPLIDTFLNGVLEGLTSDEMAKKFLDSNKSDTPKNPVGSDTANLQELSGFLDQAKLGLKN
jgi:hypothetical protein